MTNLEIAALVIVLFAVVVAVLAIVQKNIHIWLLSYLKGLIRQRQLRAVPIQHVYLCVADHYEPYNGGVDKETADRRVDEWVRHFPDSARKYVDSDGNHPCVTFFYPEEEYDFDHVRQLEGICGLGVGDVEVHLHHDHDTAEDLRRKLTEFKNVLHEKHGFLRRDQQSGEITYAFIHGNWALDNSRPDGRWCGVSNELQVLIDTGCYMDMTLPSAPSPTQTSKINSLYFAKGIEGKTKSHDTGRDVKTDGAWQAQDELLMVQGPLTFNANNRKLGIMPRIEAGELSADALPSLERLKLWMNCRISVAGSEESVFIKLHTHGAEDRNIDALVRNGGLDRLWSLFDDLASKDNSIKLHYVSAFNFYQAIRGLVGNSKP